MNPDVLAAGPSSAESRLEAAERRLQRERLARREVEEIAERTTRALYDKQRDLVLLEAVVSASNESATVGEALQGAVDAICEHTRWPVGHAYLRERASGDLVPSAIWHVEDAQLFAAFRGETDRVTFSAGCGLPGRVLTTGAAVWVADVATDPSFERRDLGVRAAFAFPIHGGGEMRAVLEFFHRQAVAPDTALLEMMAQVGKQLGRVIERIRAHDQLAHQATHDTLTGLANRLLFRECLDLALARAQRQGSQAAVLFLDLDRFKDVNDTLGHTAGDQLLVEVSRRLKESLRRSDRVSRAGDPFTLARFGGDEFVVLCEDLDSDGDAIQVAERLGEVLRRPFVLGEEEYIVTASIGIVLAANRDRDADALLRDADIAMYRAKYHGLGQWELFDERLRERAVERVAVGQGLRKALENRQLRLHYQPIVTLDDGNVSSLEALVRWQHPQRGLVPPGDFIPAAEESGLILEIGAWILREACEQARRWRDRLGALAPLPVSVNVSARQLAQADLPELVARVLRETGLRPADLALEITETALIEESDVPAASLRALRTLGVKILLDDFGTGYSSLSHLQRFPVDALKIDRSFVMHLGAGDENRAIVRAMAAMADALGLEVVAEGVETYEQAAHAQALGCSRAQGFHFAQPMPAAEIESLIRP